MFGKVRFEYEAVLKDIINKCTETEIFKERQTKKAIEYIRKKYKDECEFPWDDDNIIIRNKDSKKWYALFMTISRSKLGIESKEDVEVVNLHTLSEMSEIIVDNEGIFPAYHMNKKSWITVLLDSTISDEELFELIDNSYKLSIEEKKIDRLAKKTYEYLRTIPKGKVVTYGQIAKHLGNRGLSRLVGTILHNNPDGEKNPCYKVVNGKGELAECFVFGGINQQKVLLENDGIVIKDNKVDLKKYQWEE